MGLLGKAIASTTTVPESECVENTHIESVQTETVRVSGVQALVTDFHRAHGMFHCIIFNGVARNFADMLAYHNAVCVDMPRGNCLVLLPGGLDLELFIHRLSGSTGSAIRCQLSMNEISLALEQLNPYLQ